MLQLRYFLQSVAGLVVSVRVHCLLHNKILLLIQELQEFQNLKNCHISVPKYYVKGYIPEVLLVSFFFNPRGGLATSEDVPIRVT